VVSGHAASIADAVLTTTLAQDDHHFSIRLRESKEPAGRRTSGLSSS